MTDERRSGSGDVTGEVAGTNDETGSGTGHMTGQQGPARVGIRPASAERRRARSIVWALTGDLDLALGDRVSVLVPCYEWLGEVVVPPERLVEWPDAFATGQMPVVMRRATDDEWPAPQVTAGRRLLDSLGLPPELLARPRVGSAPSPLVSRSGSGDPAEDERGDQERGGDQREPE